MPPYEVGNAPYGASYTPPRQDMSWLGDLPQTFYQGAAARRAYNLAGAFPEGMPKDAQGNPDFGEMTNRILKIAGPDAAGPIINKMMLMQMAQGMGNPENEPGAAGGQPSQPTVTGGPRNTPNTGPAHLGARPAAVPPDQDHNAQGDNIRSLVTEHLPGAENPKLIQYLAGKMFPGDEQGDMRTLSPDQAQQVVKALTTYKSQSASAAGPPGPSPAGMAPGVGMPPQTGGQAAAQPGPAASGPAAAPVGPTPGPGPAPAGPYAQNSGGAMVAPRAGGGVPGAGGEQGIPPEFSLAARAALDRKLQRYTQEASRRELVIPGSGKGLEARMNTISNQIKAIDDFRSKYFEPTGPMKEAAASGQPNPAAYEATKKRQDLEIAAGEKTYQGIAAAERASNQNQHYIDVGRSAINDPRFYSGVGSDFNAFLKKVQAGVTGGDPNAAVAQEALQKTTASSILSQVEQQRADLAEMGGASSRLFQQQINLMTRASAGKENTIQGNLLLLEMQDRLGKFNRKLADMARSYLQDQKNWPPGTVPHLDPRFDGMVANYLQKNPMFKESELKHIETIAPRTFVSHADAVRELPAGYHTPYRTTTGTLKMVP